MHKSTTLFKSIIFFVFLFPIAAELCGDESYFILAQESKIAKIDTIQTTNSNLPNAPQAEQGDVKITDGTNTLIRITDEGTFGAIEIKDGVPSTTTDKLYNDAGTLKFDGSTLGGGSGATEINDLTDARYDGASVYLGTGAGTNEVGGSNHNVAIGKDVLKMNTQGKHNTATGSGALQQNTTGDANTAVGQLSLNGNTTADSNSAFGWQALRSNSTGSSNTAIGTATLWQNTTGSYNTANGRNALYSNKIGSNNTASGQNTLHSNTSGSHNTAIGHNSLNKNTTANRNTATGNSSLSSNTTGANNAAFGAEALMNNVDGDGNVGVGQSALHTNNSGGGNVGVGINSLYRNTAGSANIALGQGSQYFNTTGSNNTGIGYRANLNNSTGVNNTVIGHEAGAGAGSSKSGSVFIGHQAGFNETADDKLYIDNSSTTIPLIYGDFDLNHIKIHGSLEVTNTTTVKGGIRVGSDGSRVNTIKMLEGTTEANGLVTSVPYPDGFTYWNTHVIAFKIKKTNEGFAYYALSKDQDKSFYVKLESPDIKIWIPSVTLGVNYFKGAEYEMVLMRI